MPKMPAPKGTKAVYDADGTTRYVKATTTKKTKPVSGKKKSAMVAKGKPYKGQSSKKSVKSTRANVKARSGKTGKAATKQARRIVRARKAK